MKLRSSVLPNSPCRRCRRWSMPATTWSPSIRARPSPPAAASRSARRRCINWRTARPAGAHAEDAQDRRGSARPSRRSISMPPSSSSYGHILTKRFLDAPVLGCINIHGSLLPRWRGAAPIHRAILAGDAETGVTTMRMDEGLDTGPMLLAERTPISAADTAETVHDRLADTGRDADRVDARRADAPLDRSDAAVRAKASPTPTSSARRKARSTGGGPRPSSSARCAPSIPGPARRSPSTASASRCWPRRWRWPAARRAR